MKFTITLDRDEDGRGSVECPAIPGRVSGGETKDEALENIKDAIGAIMKHIILTLTLILAIWCSQSALAQSTKQQKKLNLALTAAAKKGDFKQAKILLDKGADANARNENGNPALYVACMGSNANLVRLLLDKGARVNDKNGDGKDALGNAVGAGQIQIATILLNRGANVNSQDAIGWTILMHAVLMEITFRDAVANGAKYFKVDKDLKMIKLLLERGAKVDVKFKTGATLLDLAEKDIAIKRLLLTAQANQRRGKPSLP